jgi:hypothetical protein
MTVEVTTREFESAHGKRPSGRGTWGFCPSRFYNDDQYLTHVFWYNGLYSDAKRAAVEHFSSLRAGLVVVCS